MTNIPTIQDLFNDLKAAFESQFGITVNPVGNAFLTALCGVLAGILYLYYLAIGFTQKNIWFDTADSEKNGGTLERFGRTILGRNPFAAIPGQYICSVTGSAGAVIPAGSVFRSDDTAQSPGKLYQLMGAAVTLTGSGDTITIIALEGGLDSRLAVADTLTGTAPIINVNSGITVTTEHVVPVDAEDIEVYRNNISEKVLLEPGSWSAADYRILGTGVNGVGQTYAYNKSGASGEVNVYLQGTTPVASPGPSVSGTVITDYTNALDAVFPLGVWAYHIYASTIRNVDVTITMGSFPAFTTSQKADILKALQDFVNGVHPFIPAADNVADRNDIVATYNLTSTVSQAVPGYGFSGLAFTVAGSPTTKWQADNGEIPFLNSVTYA